MSARQLLAGAVGPLGAAEAVERWEAVDRSKRGNLLPRVALGLLCVAAVGIVASSSRAAYAYREVAAYFAAYYQNYHIAHPELPPDYLEIVRSIDPVNAWFTYIAAAEVGRDCVEQENR